MTVDVHRLETVTDALTRLCAAGYTVDFYATLQGRLACRCCDRTMNPTEVRVDHTIRFEGDTNPYDEDIVVAIECAGGHRGTYSAAYGPTTPPADSDVLRLLVRTPTTRPSSRRQRPDSTQPDTTRPIATRHAAAPAATSDTL